MKASSVVGTSHPVPDARLLDAFPGTDLSLPSAALLMSKIIHGDWALNE